MHVSWNAVIERLDWDVSGRVCVFNIVIVVNCRTTLFLWCSHHLGSKNWEHIIKKCCLFSAGCRCSLTASRRLWVWLWTGGEKGEEGVRAAWRIWPEPSPMTSNGCRETTAVVTAAHQVIKPTKYTRCYAEEITDLIVSYLIKQIIERLFCGK